MQALCRLGLGAFSNLWGPAVWCVLGLHTSRFCTRLCGEVTDGRSQGLDAGCCHPQQVFLVFLHLREQRTIAVEMKGAIYYTTQITYLTAALSVFFGDLDTAVDNLLFPSNSFKCFFSHQRHNPNKKVGVLLIK